MQPDKKLNFEEQLKKVESNVNKTIGIIRKLQNVLPRSALLTIYKSFIRPHLNYGDIIYDKLFNEPFHAKLESLQYNIEITSKYYNIFTLVKHLVKKNICIFEVLVLHKIYCFVNPPL